MKKPSKYLLILATTAITSQQLFALTNSGMNVTLPQTAPAPSTGVYYNSNGKYAGTTQSVNGSTSYYNNGHYQGQAPNGSNEYYNQQNTPEIVNSSDGGIDKNY
ncbi:MAG: hypothetical protein E6Q32_06915 [Neisseriales bacterium]|jgi:hypothetical protein|nr:MAG: hypothetical protein E6Q32_06915 [Neisseriales bacterium]